MGEERSDFVPNGVLFGFGPTPDCAGATDSTAGGAPTDLLQPVEERPERLEEWTVAQLKTEIRAREIDMTGCTEKHELVKLLQEHPPCLVQRLNETIPVLKRSLKFLNLQIKPYKHRKKK